MSFFDEKSNVTQYIEMTKDYKGDEMLKYLWPYLKKDSTLLELGMGPGKDLDFLSKTYKVTGSDTSQVFLDLYRERNSDIALVKLDAATIKIDSKFNCIYSNKVLHHLTKVELIASIKRQTEVLEVEGIIFHTFWLGQGVEDYDGLLFNYYSIDDIKDFFDKYFDIIEIEMYKEEKENDSIYVIGKKK